MKITNLNIVDIKIGKNFAAYATWLARHRMAGTDLAEFKCPCCGVNLSTFKPSGSQVFDSTAICPSCDELYLKVVFNNPEGYCQVVVNKLETINHENI